MRRRRMPGGQALVETAIVLPLQVALTLGILQAGLLSMGNAFTRYAAFAAARAALPEPAPVRVIGRAAPGKRRPDPARAAQIALLPVTGTSLPAALRTGGAFRMLPLGEIPGVRLLDPLRQAAARAKTRVTVRGAQREVRARVEHDFELVIPWVGAWFARWGGLRAPRDYGGIPHVTLSADCVLPR